MSSTATIHTIPSSPSRQPAIIRHRLPPKKIAVALQQETRIIHIADIMYCTAESNYCHLWLKNGERLLLSKTLKAVEQAISGPGFIRIHQSFLVNVDFIRSFTPVAVKMFSGKELSIARSRRHEVEERILKGISIF